jgi:hypothetical protein
MQVLRVLLLLALARAAAAAPMGTARRQSYHQSHQSLRAMWIAGSFTIMHNELHHHLQ